MKTTPWALLTLCASITGVAVAQEATPAPQAAPASPAPVTFVTNVTVMTNITVITNGVAVGTSTTVTNGEKGLRLNFRGVPLEMVLNYMSDAAGFIIVPEADIRGMVDVWSNEPLTREEAVDLLNTVLARNGYAAIRSGRTLRIVSREDAKKRDIPVKSGADPQVIARSEEMVIQVVPVRHANATQLTQNLLPLMPTYAEMTANESGNALVITATETDVRRMVEIVKALDTSISSVSTVRVFPLRYADAKELANTIKELFQPPQQQTTGGRQMNAVFNPFGGGGGPGGFGGGRGGGGGGGRSPAGNSSVANTRVTAVGDEASNALIVGAPEDVIPTIEALIREVDVEIVDVTELRVFHLKNADPSEMAAVFTELFPDPATAGQNQQGNRNPFGFFGNRGGNNRNRGNNQAGASSDRKLKMGRVVAVPDQRTKSIIVSAAREMMPEIEQMIEQLDGNPARKQKVYVYDLENADVTRVQQVLQDMFQRENVGNRNAANQNSALMNRSTINNQVNGNNNNNSGRIGNSGIGGGNNLGTGQAFR